ncbi:putative RFA1 protein [Calycina marina]|uniref:Replication protein A subunit n=1 Tax=Calycina marina TaxID=1763456 RepID=A0A9P7Z393_9HELO|nr:putative RFA1 protein [Calycina marina]
MTDQRVAAARAQITTGALDAIFNENSNLENRFPVPVFQCVQIKKLGSQGDSNPERYRIVLSDVSNFVQSMLATQANHVVHDDKLKKGSIVRLKSYQANAVKGKRILIVLDLEVIEHLGEMDKIGEPVALMVKEEQDIKPMNTTISGDGFYGNSGGKPQQQQQQVQKSLPSRPTGNTSIYPIEGLSPYHNKWTIKARVTNKSDIKTWHKQTGDGKLFSVNLLDQSGEIKATGFNDQCDLLYEQLQEGSVYYISGCKVQFAKKQFSTLPNDYELTFERDSVVEKAEDSDEVPQVQYNFSTVGDLQTIEKDATIDIIAVLKEVHEVSQIVSKTTSRPYDKRDLTIVDESGYSVRMTIWGKGAVSFDANPEAVVAFKGVKVGDFGGRSLSLLSSGSMAVDPDIPEAHRLKGWYDSNGRTNNFASHSNLASAVAAGGRTDVIKTIAEVRDENLGLNGEEADYFTTKATVVYVKNENFAYPGCMSEGCSKKVIDVGDGWRCEKCNIVHPRPEYRYIMQASINDPFGQIYVSCFDDQARVILGRTADELMEMAENDPAAKDKVFEDSICKSYNFRCKAKMDTFQDQQRVRYQALSVTPLDYAKEATKLAALIDSYHLTG